MAGYFYRGRHRKPTQAGRKAATIAVTGAVGLGLAPTAAYAGPADGWDGVIACESGNNAAAQNASSTASGLFQFITSTWRAYGGLEFAPIARLATVAEQHIVAERAYAVEGLRPWNASKSCWSGRVGTGSARESAPPAASDTPTPALAVTSGRTADGSGTYTCDQGHLHFNACDPGNLGQVVDYPLHASRHRAPEPAVAVTVEAQPAASASAHVVAPGDTLSDIAVALHVEGGWTALHNRNHDVIGDNPHLIYPGQRLNL